MSTLKASGEVLATLATVLPTTYVWTYDSVGRDEEGLAQQPVEHLAALRATPGLDIVRPADANETAACWVSIVHHGRPAGLILSRQDLPVLERARNHAVSADKAAFGGYVLSDRAAPGEPPDVILIATGSEVHVALQASGLLLAEGIAARVVSMPCREWFAAQALSYRNRVLPPAIRARVSVEAGSGESWREIVGESGRIVSLEHFEAFAVAAAAKESLYDVTITSRSGGWRQTAMPVTAAVFSPARCPQQLAP